MLDSAAQDAPESRESQEALWAGVALTCLVRQRMSLVRRLIEGELNPLLIWNPRNDAGELVGPDSTDLVLREWTLAQQEIHARLELDRIERRMASRKNSAS